MGDSDGGWICRHKWKLMVNKNLPSAVQQLSSAGFTNIETTENLYKITSIVIMVCKKCGVIDKTITTSLEGE
jgi:hypothetical protein